MLDRLFESASQRWHMVLPEAPGQRRCCRKDHGSMSSAMIMRPGRWIEQTSNLKVFFSLGFLCVDSIVAVQSTALRKVWKMQTYLGQLRKNMVWPSGMAWCPSMQHCAMTSFVPLARLLWWTSDEVCEALTGDEAPSQGICLICIDMPHSQWTILKTYILRSEMNEDGWSFCCSCCGWWWKKLECQDNIVEKNVAITLWLFFCWLRSWMIDDQYRLISLVFHC